MADLKPGYYTDEHGRWYWSGFFWYIGSADKIASGPYAGNPHFVGAGKTKEAALKDLEITRLKKGNHV